MYHGYCEKSKQIDKAKISPSQRCQRSTYGDYINATGPCCGFGDVLLLAMVLLLW